MPSSPGKSPATTATSALPHSPDFVAFVFVAAGFSPASRKVPHPCFIRGALRTDFLPKCAIILANVAHHERTVSPMSQHLRMPDLAAQRAAMRKLNFLIGSWSGEARL